MYEINHIEYILIHYPDAITTDPQYFPGLTGYIFLDEVNCTGVETNILDCLSVDPGTHNCLHTEDVGLVCPGQCLMATYEIKWIAFMTLLLYRCCSSSNTRFASLTQVKSIFYNCFLHMLHCKCTFVG